MVDTVLQIVQRFGAPVFGVVLVLLIIRLFMMLKKLDASFTKLGYFTREDTKKYFDEAAKKAADLNENISEENKKTIEAGMKRAMIDSGVVMEKALADSQQEATAIIITAKENAQRIVDDAEHRASMHYDQSMDKAVAALEWVLSQYLKDHVDIKEHQKIIDDLVKVYTDGQ